MGARMPIIFRHKGALAPPPLEIKKYGGPHKDNLMRKNFKNIYLKN